MAWVDICRAALALIIVGYVSRPRETAAEPFLDELLKLFGYAERSGAGLLDGTGAFARRVPTRKLPVPGDVALLFGDAIDGAGLEGASEMPRIAQ